MSQIGRYFSYCTAFHDKNIILHICDLFLGICEIPCHLCSVPNLLYYKYSELVNGKLYNDILLQEGTKGVIRIRKSKKNRQRNGQEKKDKQRSTKHTHKTKDRVTRTPLKTGGELRCSEMGSSSCSISGTCRVITIYLARVIVVDINEIRTETKICKVKCGQVITALHRV
jgi:hypothetical protein